VPHYFYPICAGLFHERIEPALGGAWRQRNFALLRPLCVDLLARIGEFHQSYRGLEGKTLIEDLADATLPFDRHVWRAVAGEILLFAADELPLLDIAPTTLRCLLAGENFEREPTRREYRPIEQALLGSRDLVFGGAFYRPEAAGVNDVDDVARLHSYLQGTEPRSWQTTDLLRMVDLADVESCCEELEFVRQGWPEFVGLFRQAGTNGRVVVCEV
jgi:hypothetical protein